MMRQFPNRIFGRLMSIFDAKMLSTCLMVASLHASKEDSYYQAYAQLQAALALPSATFDGPTVRAAAVAASMPSSAAALPLLVRPIL